MEARDVMFRAGLLQDALGISASDVNSRFIDVSDIVDRGRVDRLFSDLENERSVSDYVRLFEVRWKDLLQHFSARKALSRTQVEAGHRNRSRWGRTEAPSMIQLSGKAQEQVQIV